MTTKLMAVNTIALSNFRSVAFFFINSIMNNQMLKKDKNGSYVINERHN